ncbi:MAG: type II toxin-antitoxin system VapC family toxin [Anaerolineae bacterium]|nr:type II toxin-antitoxin system VapC family toxin [Caldilineales bacterium]MDW8268062.1 type II toxin-antitoxin system VapC family toxin [Anaerolineae bacterium]
MPNNLVCLDASFLVRLVTSYNDPRPRSLVETWLNQGYRLVAPTLLLYEITNALYLYERVGQLDRTAVFKTLNVVMALPIQLHGEPDLHREALILAFTHNLKATYDAHYLALAQRLNADLWTADSRLVRAVQSAWPWIHLVE